MNVQETLAVLEALKRTGATHFKSQDFEVTLGLITPALEPPFVPTPAAGPAQPQPPPPQENNEATEKLKSLIQTLSLPADQLADKMFPPGAER
jgi:hypothetical protein